MPPAALPLPLPVIAPTEAEWQRMTPAERDALLVRILDALSDPAQAMSEGRRHKKAKTRTLDALGQAELPGTADLIDRLNSRVAELEAKSQVMVAELEKVEEQVQSALRESITALLAARGIPCSEQGRARLTACSDVATLQRWLLRGTTAASEQEIFSD